jgi:hypothetical protein
MFSLQKPLLFHISLGDRLTNQAMIFDSPELPTHLRRGNLRRSGARLLPPEPGRFWDVYLEFIDGFPL